MPARTASGSQSQRSTRSVRSAEYQRARATLADLTAALLVTLRTVRYSNPSHHGLAEASCSGGGCFALQVSLLASAPSSARPFGRARWGERGRREA